MFDQNYTIKEARFDHQFESHYGVMYSYNLVLTDAHLDEIGCYINQKEQTTPPAPGQMLFGHTVADKLGNPKFVKAQPQATGDATSSPAALRAPNPAGNPTSTPRSATAGIEDDERQRLIVMQNALSNANKNAGDRATVFIAQERFDEAERVLKPSSIAVFQMWFYKASMGLWRPDITIAEALDLLGYSQDDIASFVQDAQAASKSETEAL